MTEKLYAAEHPMDSVVRLVPRASDTAIQVAAGSGTSDRPVLRTVLFLSGIAISLGWIAACASFTEWSIGLENLTSLLPHELGGLLAGVAAPIALLWMIAAYGLRASTARADAGLPYERLAELTLPGSAAEERVRRLTEALRAQATVLDTAAGQTLDRVAQAEKTLARQAENLTALHAKACSEIERIASAFRDQTQSLRQLVESCGDQAKQTGAEAQATADRLERSAAATLVRTADMAATLKSSAEAFAKAIADTTQRSQESLTAIEKRTDGLSGSLAGAAARLESGGATFDRLLAGYEAANQRAGAEIARIETISGKHVEALDRAVAGAGERLSGSEALMTKLAADIDRAAEAQAEQARTLLAGLEKKAGDLQEGATRIARRGAEISGRFVRQGETLMVAGAAMTDRFEKLLAATTDATSSLEAAGQSSVGRAQAIEAAIRDGVLALDAAIAQSALRADDIADRLRDRADALTSATEDIGARVDTLTDGLARGRDQLTEMIASAGTEAARLDTALSTFSSNAVEHLAPLSDRVDGMVAQTAAAAREITERMTEVATFYQQRLAGFEGGSKEAAALVRGASELVTAKLAALADAATLADDRLRTFGTALDQQSSSLDRAADQAVDRLEQARHAIDAQSSGLASAVSLSRAQLDDMGGALQTRAAAACELSGQIVATLGAAGQAASHEAGELATAIRRLGGVTAELRRESEEALTQIAHSRETLDRAGDRIADIARTVGEELDVAAEKIIGVGVRTRAETANFANAQDGMDERLAGAFLRIDEMVRRLGTTTEQARLGLDEAGQAFATQTERLASASTTAAGSVKGATAVFLSQASALNEASAHAMEQAEKVRGAEQQARREVFLNSAKFVLESLHSLSVDVNRLLDRDIPDKIWKSYHAGDAGIFTKRLLVQRDRMPLDRIRTKFQEDETFRGFVLRYFRHYEELFDQAVAQDHSALLSTTLMTSDVGKLYLLLCSVVGRERRH